MAKGHGAFAVYLDNKVFGVTYYYASTMAAGRSALFPIYDNTEAGLSIDVCNNDDWEILGHVVLKQRSGMKIALKPTKALKACLHSKVFYVSTAGLPQHYAGLVQSIMDGKAEEC